jgi:hypothetical protein
MEDAVGRPNRQAGARAALLGMLISLAAAASAGAQATAATGGTPPDDAPSIKVGATIFADYTYQVQPEVRDADDNTVRFNSFNVGRTYINVTGSISHLLAFRITPDIVREMGPGSSLAGSLTFRLKYGYAQLNLADWMPQGTWVRLGIQQTPWVDFEESVYRYRFQGPIFADREGLLSSSDAGVSFRTAFPRNHGDVHAGIYNGETYSRPEANDRKAIQIRGTFRPLPAAATLRGLRFTAFYDADSYVRDGERNRVIAAATFEHRFANAAVQYLGTKDRTSITRVRVDGRGYSAWVTPKLSHGVEGLLRYDDLQPNDSVDAHRKRTIAGVAWWLPHQGTVASAFLLDYEQVNPSGFLPAQPRQKRVALHALVNF